MAIAQLVHPHFSRGFNAPWVAMLTMSLEGQTTFLFMMKPPFHRSRLEFFWDQFVFGSDDFISQPHWALEIENLWFIIIIIIDSGWLELWNNPKFKGTATPTWSDPEKSMEFHLRIGRALRHGDRWEYASAVNFKCGYFDDFWCRGDRRSRNFEDSDPFLGGGGNWMPLVAIPNFDA